MASGTEMYCPECKCLQICQAVPPQNVDNVDPDQRIKHDVYPNVQWFRRGRICQKCEYEFHTAEIYEARFLWLLGQWEELLELRKTLTTIDSEQCQKAVATTYELLNRISKIISQNKKS